MRTDRFGRNYLFNLASQLSSIALPLVTTPYLSRVLGAQGIGKYSFAQSIVSYFVLFAALGTQLYGQRIVASADDRDRGRLFREIFIIRAIGAAVAFVLYTVAVTPLSDARLLYTVAGAEIISVAIDISWFYQGREDFGKIAAFGVASKLIAAVLIFLFVKSKEDLVLYVAILCGSAIFGQLLSWISLPKAKNKAAGGRLRIGYHMLPVLSLFVSQAAMQIYIVLDKTMIGVITGSDLENGYYEQSQKLIRVLVAAATSLGTVMASRVASLWGENKKSQVYSLIERSFRFALALGIPMAVGVSLVADRFVPAFYGEGFEPVVPLISVLGFMIPVIGCSNVVGIQLLVPTGRERLLTASVVIGAISNLALNIPLIYYFASWGAAIASLAAETVVTAVQFYFVRREMRPLTALKISLRYIAFGALIWLVGKGVSAVAPDGLLGVAVIALPCIIVYGGLLFLVRDPVLELFSVKDFRRE